MYSVELSREAIKDIKKIDKKQAIIILKKIYSIRKNPKYNLERLKRVDLWKLRIGDYRSIIRFDTKNKIIFVTKIGHRKNIYQNL